jgi:hypothetical protein
VTAQEKNYQVPFAILMLLVAADALDRPEGASGVNERGLSLRLILLRQHPVLGLKVMSGMGDELPVARMIHGLHTDDLLHQGRIILADVLYQLSFRIGWSCNENCGGVCNRLRDCLKEGLILSGMPAPDRVCLVVDVLGRVIRVQHEPFHVDWAEMEHACLMMIDPDSRMKVMIGHDESFRRPGRTARPCS